MVFTSIILRIMIIFVGFLKPCTVCIIINTITIFPIWNYSDSLFEFLSLTFSFFLLIIQYHVFFSPLPNASESLYMSTPQLSISYPLAYSEGFINTNTNFKLLVIHSLVWKHLWATQCFRWDSCKASLQVMPILPEFSLCLGVQRQTVATLNTLHHYNW